MNEPAKSDIGHGLEVIEAQEKAVREVTSKLRKDHPEVTQQQAETAIRNAVADGGTMKDTEKLETLARHHLGLLP